MHTDACYQTRPAEDVVEADWDDADPEDLPEVDVVEALADDTEGEAALDAVDVASDQAEETPEEVTFMLGGGELYADDPETETPDEYAVFADDPEPVPEDADALEAGAEEDGETVRRRRLALPH